MYTIANNLERTSPQEATTESKPPKEDLRRNSEVNSDIAVCYVPRKNTRSTVTMVISYARDLVLFCLLFILTAYATYQNSPLKVSRAPPPSPFIRNTTLVEDFTTGKLAPTQNNVALSEISFVLYYAPWCAESRSVRQVYENVAQELRGLAYFAAINCWEPRGECRIQYANVPTWPTLMAYRSNGIGIQYNGMWKEEALVKFVHSLIHPLVRLDNVEDLINLSSTNTIVVCAFLDVAKNYTAFRHFYQTALKFLELDPSRDLVFAVCLGKNVRSFGVEVGVPKLRVYTWDKIFEFKNSSHWMQYELVSFIKQAVRTVSEWATPLGIKANDIGVRFVERAALIVFTPRPYSPESSAIVDMVKQFGYSYRNCYNDTWLQRLNQNYVRQLRHGNLAYQSPDSSTCFDDWDAGSAFGLYQDSEEPWMTCSRGSSDDEFLEAVESVQGYACLSQKNLSIIFMDLIEHRAFAERYGPKISEAARNDTRILLFDAEDETVHLLRDVTPQGISKFIRDYTEGSLKPDMRSMYSLPTTFTETPRKPTTDGTYFIREITSRQFEAHVMIHNKTTFVLFHSSYCAFCQTMSYYLLNVARHFAKLPQIDFFRIDVDKNDLDEKYKVINLPTLAVFPAHRKYEVRIFPYSKEVNTSNLINFVFSNIPKPIRLNILITLCSDMKHRVIAKFCTTTLRKEVSSNISHALKSWSAARNSSQRTFESRKIYYLKRMYLQLLNSNSKNFKGIEKEVLSYVNL